MDFQKLFGPLTKPREDRLFHEISGHERIKRLFSMALRSHETTHILLTGPPATAKTMFIMSLREDLKDSYFIDGGNAAKAGIIDHLFKNRAPYLLLDEIDKIAPRDQTFLLNLMETGIVAETKFATCNDPRKLSAALQSRFFIVELEPYTYEQFYDITLDLLDSKHGIARPLMRYGIHLGI